MTTPSYYAIIPAKVRYDRRLKANEKLLYAELTSLTQIDGYSWATNKYFAELYGVSKETISRWLSNLQSCGYIQIEVDEKDNSSRRIFTIPLEETQKDIDENINTSPMEDQPPMTKTSSTHDEKIKTPHDEKIKQNNTSINNKNNNIYNPPVYKYTSPLSQKTETRHKHGEYNNVLFTDDDYEKLKEKRPDDYQEWIDKLSAYMASTGKVYKNHYVTICNWIRREQEEQEQQAIQQGKQYSYEGGETL